ncbi:MAG: hypothetical protein JKX92_01550 [Porticoccaceae bacterium]|nr:hypothetical protein [Porticoccaceae bacterium]OUS04931.1 hypothetical protein A9Q90_07000 [Gammaproteobacteria bacterium 54_18_T64]
MKQLAIGTALVLLLTLSACTTTTVDEYRENDISLTLGSSERVVVLGRRHYADYETEPDFIDCIGEKLNADKVVAVLPERQFVDLLYPWFEPRTAPLGLKRLAKMLDEPMIARRFKEQGLRYMIWIDGSTETTERDGSVSCAIGPGGGGCFGFATWEKTGTYEAIIWDLQTLDESGRVKVEARGSSYMVAIILPIPIIAQVQDQACDGIGRQLRSFFMGNRARETTAQTP